MLHILSPDQIVLLGALTIAASIISIIAGALSLYWFSRMRRAFRHHLIMLLILSNLWRAIWYFLFPVISFTQGAIPTQSAICQLSGFMLSYGIEGADFAVLVIAVHAALCIFNTSAALGEAGLYRFRPAVYTLWLALPALAAGLAFINHDTAYMTTGAYCYLPVRPIWYRLALAWIPRYLILIVIASIYLSIYLFVRRKFTDYRSSAHNSDRMPFSDLESQRKGVQDTRCFPPSQSETAGSLVPTLVGESPSNMSGRWTVPQKHSVDSNATGPAWEKYSFGAATPLAKLPDSETIKTDPSLLKSPSRLNSNAHHPNDSHESVSHIIEALQDSQLPKSTSSGLPGLTLIDSHDRPIEESTMRARHRHIKRQMRFLFVYPVVYLISWIIPFVSHCLSYNDAYVQNPNFGLTVTRTVILALQAAIDSILFCTRETPWRSIDSDSAASKTFLGSLTPRLGPRCTPSQAEIQLQAANTAVRGASTTTHLSLMFAAARKASDLWRGSRDAPGRPKSQTVAEARVAHERKEAEDALARQALDARRRQRTTSLARRGGRDRSWWEQEGRQRQDSVLLGLGVGSEGRMRDGNTLAESESADLEKGINRTCTLEPPVEEAIGQGVEEEGSRMITAGTGLVEAAAKAADEPEDPTRQSSKAVSPKLEPAEETDDDAVSALSQPVETSSARVSALYEPSNGPEG